MAIKIIDLCEHRLARQADARARLAALFTALRLAREVLSRVGSEKSRRKLDECEILLRQTYPAFNSQN